MARYDRSYDFGMRGYGQTTRPLERGRPRYPSSDRSFDLADPLSGRGYLPSHHVSARYNRDYVDAPRARPRGDRFASERFDRPMDEGSYRRLYASGTDSRAPRGSWGPPPYDRYPFPRGYGGRYPDSF